MRTRRDRRDGELRGGDLNASNKGEKCHARGSYTTKATKEDTQRNNEPELVKRERREDRGEVQMTDS